MAQCQVHMESLKDLICKRIRELRSENKMTQQEVANYLRIDRSNYSKYELGKLDLSIEIVIKLSKLYNVSTDYIFNLKDY
ncbi:MAG: helix-turn-helix transcriptional regulator [Clostridia bacterium]